MENNLNSSMPDFCDSCGATLREDDLFCPKCGHKIEPISAASVETVAKPDEPVDAKVETTTFQTETDDQDWDMETDTTKPTFVEKAGLNNPVVKWTLIILGVFIVGLISTVLIINEINKCDVAGCNKQSVKGGAYCYEHTCKKSNCFERCVEGHDYCSVHQAEYEEIQRKSEAEKQALFEPLVGTWQSVYVQSGRSWNNERSQILYYDKDYVKFNITIEGKIVYDQSNSEQLSVCFSDDELEKILGFHVDEKVAGYNWSDPAIKGYTNLWRYVVDASGDNLYEVTYSKDSLSLWTLKKYKRISTSHQGGYGETSNATKTTSAWQTKTGIATDALNVRRDPSTKNDRVGLLKKGTSVTIVGESGDFWEIEYSWSVGGQSGSTAYVHKDYVKIGSDEANSVNGTNSAHATEARSEATMSVPLSGSEGDFEYELINNGTAARIEKYTGASRDVTIPDTIAGKPVIEIGEDAFSYCDYLISVIIPNGVTSIDYAAFAQCTALTNVTIPNSVTAILGSAFSNCRALSSVTIPNSVVSIGDCAFLWCTSLREVTIPDSVTSIGKSAFSSCSSLTSVNISKGITRIEKGTFWDCEALVSFSIPSGVTYVGEQVFYNCTSLTSVTIPLSVNTIDEDAFFNCTGLRTVRYGGTQTDRANIRIDESNIVLNASWVAWVYQSQSD